MVARAVKQISAFGRIQIEKDAGHDNNLLLETRLEEVQTVRDGTRQTFKIEPQVERAVGYELDHETHVAQSLDDVVSLCLHPTLSEGGLISRLERNLHGSVSGAQPSPSAQDWVQAWERQLPGKVRWLHHRGTSHRIQC